MLLQVLLVIKEKENRRAEQLIMLSKESLICNLIHLIVIS